MADHSRILSGIAHMDDADGLRNIMRNARGKGVDNVAEAAFLRLVEVLPQAAPGTVEHDFWRTISAYEEMLREIRGKAVRLTRTRAKIAKVGVKQTLADFATDPAAPEGFRLLLERKLPELTSDAIILRHADEFSPEVVAGARLRLSEAGVNVDDLAQPEAVAS